MRHFWKRSHSGSSGISANRTGPDPFSGSSHEVRRFPISRHSIASCHLWRLSSESPPRACHSFRTAATTSKSPSPRKEKSKNADLSLSCGHSDMSVGSMVVEFIPFFSLSDVFVWRRACPVLAPMVASLAPPAGFEPAARRLEGACSIPRATGAYTNCIALSLPPHTTVPAAATDNSPAPRMGPSSTTVPLESSMGCSCAAGSRQSAAGRPGPRYAKRGSGLYRNSKHFVIRESRPGPRSSPYQIRWIRLSPHGVRSGQTVPSCWGEWPHGAPKTGGRVSSPKQLWGKPYREQR